MKRVLSFLIMVAVTFTAHTTIHAQVELNIANQNVFKAGGFGDLVSLEGDTLVIGAAREDSSTIILLNDIKDTADRGKAINVYKRDKDAYNLSQTILLTAQYKVSKVSLSEDQLSLMIEAKDLSDEANVKSSMLYLRDSMDEEFLCEEGCDKESIAIETYMTEPCDTNGTLQADYVPFGVFTVEDLFYKAIDLKTRAANLGQADVSVETQVLLEIIAPNGSHTQETFTIEPLKFKPEDEHFPQTTNGSKNQTQLSLGADAVHNGIYRLRITVDSNNAVEECREDNNTEEYFYEVTGTSPVFTEIDLSDKVIEGLELGEYFEIPFKFEDEQHYDEDFPNTPVGDTHVNIYVDDLAKFNELFPSAGPGDTRHMDAFYDNGLGEGLIGLRPAAGTSGEITMSIELEESLFEDPTDGHRLNRATFKIIVPENDGQPVNLNPVVTGVQDLVMDQDTVGEMIFTVSDDHTAVEDLTIYAVSTNLAVFPFTTDDVEPVEPGSAEMRLRLTPNPGAFGVVDMALIVVDEHEAFAEIPFTVTVNEVVVTPPTVSDLRIEPLNNGNWTLSFEVDKAGLTETYIDDILIDEHEFDGPAGNTLHNIGGGDAVWNTPGEHTIMVIATNEAGSDVEILTFTIEDDTPPPVEAPNITSVIVRDQGNGIVLVFVDIDQPANVVVRIGGIHLLTTTVDGVEQLWFAVAENEPDGLTIGNHTLRIEVTNEGGSDLDERTITIPDPSILPPIVETQKLIDEVTPSTIGDVITDENITVHFQDGENVLAFLRVGSSEGGSDLGEFDVTGQSSHDLRIPLRGRAMHFTLLSYVNGEWLTSADQFGVEDDRGEVDLTSRAVIISPDHSGAAIVQDTKVTFEWTHWTDIEDAQGFYFMVGNQNATNDLMPEGESPWRGYGNRSPEITVAEGQVIHALLFTYLGGEDWTYQQVVYNHRPPFIGTFSVDQFRDRIDIAPGQGEWYYHMQVWGRFGTYIDRPVSGFTEFLPPDVFHNNEEYLWVRLYYWIGRWEFIDTSIRNDDFEFPF